MTGPVAMMALGWVGTPDGRGKGERTVGSQSPYMHLFINQPPRNTGFYQRVFKGRWDIAWLSHNDCHKCGAPGNRPGAMTRLDRPHKDYGGTRDH